MDKFQIDKLLRPSSGPNDALSFKPDVGDLQSSDEEDESAQDGVYKAPKIAAAHYYDPGFLIWEKSYTCSYISAVKLRCSGEFWGSRT